MSEIDSRLTDVRVGVLPACELSLSLLKKKSESSGVGDVTAALGTVVTSPVVRE